MFGTILSSIAAFSLLAAGVYAITKQRTAANMLFLMVVALLAGVELADQFSLHPALDPETFKGISRLLEALLPAAFMVFSLIYGRTPFSDKWSKVRLGLLSSVTLVPMVILLIAGNDFSYSPDFLNERVLFLGNTGYWFYIGIMALLIVALVNVEATLVATRGIARHRMKFEAFGIMSILAVQIFYDSQGLLYRTINMNLLPIRSSVFIIAALLIGYSRAFRGNGAHVSVSRHILFRSITLLVVGFYLLGLGLIGEGMRYFGVAFGRNLTIFFAFAGGVLLLAILFSDKLRRRAKVYISKHFYANKHDYREEWIKFTSRLSACATFIDVQDAVLTVYRETFGLAGASLYLSGRDGRVFTRASEQAMEKTLAELRISDELRTYFVGRERVLNVTDGECRLSISEDMVFRQAGAWLVVPLINSNKLEGLVVLRKQIVQDTLTYDDYDLIKVLARQAALAIANLRLSEELMEIRAMAAVSRISTFVIHDLKNLTSGLSLVVDNAAEHISNPDFQQDAIRTVKNTLSKMKNLIQRLKSIPEKGMLAATVEDLDRLSRQTIQEFETLRPGTRIEYSGESVFSRVDGEEIKKVIINLVQNALEAGGERGVTVETRRENGRACIRVSDVGSGMTDDFIKNNLFRPFCSTKDKGLGIGLYQCRQIVEAHAGRIEVRSEAGKGTVFTVVLPVADAGRETQ